MAFRMFKNGKGMERRMEWLSRKWKQLSASIRIRCLFFAGIVVILSMTAGLRIWERSKQKPRVLAALQLFAKEASAQEYSLAPLIRMIQEGKMEQEGYVNLTFVDWKALTLIDFKALDFYSEWLARMDLTSSSISYRLASRRDEQMFSGEATYQIAGVGEVDIEGYLTKDQFIVRIPQLHSSYLRMDAQNIRSQYENSLLYDVLGEKVGMPEADFSVSVESLFSQESLLDRMELIQTFCKVYERKLDEVWRQVTVIKEKESRQILLNGRYENCSVFRLSLPTEAVRWYLDTILSEQGKEWLAKSVRFEEEKMELWIYLDDENKIHQIQTVVEPEVEGSFYSVEMLCSLKGEERLFDKVQMELDIKGQAECLGIRMDLENQWNGTERRSYFSIYQLRPEQIEQVRANMGMDLVTGESYIEYKLNLPFLVSDGEHNIKYFEQPIEAPDGEIVDVFELDRIEFLKFSRDFNFAFFRYFPIDP